MSSIEEYDPVSKLTMQPARGILKTTKSIDDPEIPSSYLTSGMTRSESKKIPHFDEMNIIATYHPIDKDYGHMKIEEPKTPYAAGGNVDDEMDTEPNNEETSASGIDPNTLAQRLNESSIPSTTTNASTPYGYRPSRRSIDENAIETPEELEHRIQFENQRKHHYNEFDVVRLRKKEIEAELRALEQEDATTSKESIKPILVHDHSSHHHHHVHVEDDPQHDADNQSLTPEEREHRKQFESKRKKHYNEFRVAHSTAEKEDEK